MNDLDHSPDGAPVDAREIVGIVVQGIRPPCARPHLAFMWGPEPAPVPSLAFGRERTRVRAA